MLYRKHLGVANSHTRYISSVEDDVEIVEEVVDVMRAHIEHLADLGLIPQSAKEELLRCLSKFNVDFMRAGDYEDVHEALEDFLIECSKEGGSWVGLGRSRNDHVATAIRLRMMKYLGKLEEVLRKLRCTLLKISAECADWVIPCSTHGLPAQPSTLGHYMLAVDEAVRDHIDVLKCVEGVVGKSPLGSGACGGTTVPLNREELARKLGFSKLVENTLYATGSRGFVNLTLGVAASLAVELSRFVEDLVSWSSPELGFLELHQAHVSTSSIMPHKRNPVTLEVLRARLGEVLGHYLAVLTIQRRLGMGYYLDLQEATRHVWRIMRILIDGVEVLVDLISRSKFNRVRMEEESLRHPITSFHLAEELSTSAGRAYRDSYFEVAQMLKEGVAVLPNPVETLGRYRVLGSPNPIEVRRMAMERMEEIGCFRSLA